MAQSRTVINEDGTKNVTLFLNGGLLVTDDSNPRFDEIVTRILNENLEGIEELFKPEEAIKNIFSQLTSDVVIDNGVVNFRGEPINKVLSDHIVKLWDAGENFVPVVRFLEKLQQNPNPDSVERLWAWISDRHLQLTDSGNIVGYKGLRDDFRSKHLGHDDIRNGQPVDGHILHEPGDVIEKARDRVVFDVNIGCAEGLHVGDYSYASAWGPVVVSVEVNPADVVSIPQDDTRKMRVCRYKVREQVKSESKDFYAPSTASVYSHPDAYVINNHFDRGLIVDSEKQAKRVIDVLNNQKDRTRWITDTRLNHTLLERGPDGRFLRKRA